MTMIMINDNDYDKLVDLLFCLEGRKKIEDAVKLYS
jgi:hypothetical protein